MARSPQPDAFGVPRVPIYARTPCGNGVGRRQDNWRTDQEAEIIATGIPPSSDLESALVRDFLPGNYTAIVRGSNNTTGVALVEAYGVN